MLKTIIRLIDTATVEIFWIMSSSESETGIKTSSKSKTKLKKPKLYRVILLNDDYTPMDFVVSILETIFNKVPAEAVQIMLKVHNQGQGLCGLYPKEIAEAKISLVHKRAEAAGHPLRAAMDPE